MNEPMVLPDDEMVRAMKRANRGPLVAFAALVGLAALGVGGYVLGGKHATVSELEGRGYAAVTVKMVGPFTFSFTGTKGAAQCSGTFQRIPFSTSLQEACFSSAPPSPPPSARESVERSLAKKYAADGFATFTCPTLVPSDKTTECSMAAANGTTVPIHVEAKGTAEDAWQSWSYGPTEIYARGEDLATKVPSALGPELKKRGLPAIQVDCGAGLQATRANELTCKASAAVKGKQREGTLTLTFADDGTIAKWGLVGF